MAPAKRSHSTVCAILFFDMRYFKIEQYVSEDIFFENKNDLLHKAAFADCFVVDICNEARILAACRSKPLTGRFLCDALALSAKDKAALLDLFHAKQTPLTLACDRGTLLCFPAWHSLDLSLVFLLEADLQTVEKRLKNAPRHANSPLFQKAEEQELITSQAIEKQLQTILFYTERLFGKEKEGNVVAQILMIANLVGCKLHKVSVERISTSISERELDSFSAYLFCALLTMRHFSGEISAVDSADQNFDFSAHAVQKYGLRIQQTTLSCVQKSTKFDTPQKEDVASFLHHPAFSAYRIEESEGGVCLTLPIGCGAVVFSLSAKTPTRAVKITLFPIG